MQLNFVFIRLDANLSLNAIEHSRPAILILFEHVGARQTR